MDDARNWAQEQFGHADLGDVRRTRRLVQLAAEVTSRPSGIVSRACATSASREGAFRLLESRKACPTPLREAIFEKTAKDCRGKGTVIVPVDATSLSFDDDGSKGLGRIAHGRTRNRGIHALTALALTNDGAPIGIGAQALYVRAKTHGADNESRHWLEVVESFETRLVGTGARPWFQMDRGFDSNNVLALAEKLESLITIRARSNRALDNGSSLWKTLERAPVRAKRKIAVAAGSSATQKRHRIDGKIVWSYGPPREARVAKVLIRAARVGLTTSSNGKRKPFMSINAVLVTETGRSKDDRIEWLLLTTHPIRTRADVLEVVRGYTLRWRIEDFHRAWKDGFCRVEDTQLRSRDAIYKWSTILAAVATRAMRLTHLARETPDVLASTEFSEYELRAIFIQRKPKNFTANDIPKMTLAQAIRWIADTAGYTGPWKGPPGVTIVGRGLYEVEVIARAFEEFERAKK